MARRATLVAAALALHGCATSMTPCQPAALGAAESAAFAERCSVVGDVQAAQVRLAQRYERGEGVPRDIGRAVALYEEAAAATSAPRAVYSPPVGLHGRGRVLFLNGSSSGRGSAEAQYRLGMLLVEGREVPQDGKRGMEMLRRSARQGYAPAQAALKHISR